MKVSSLFGMATRGADGAAGYVVSVYECGGAIVSLSCADSDERRFNLDADGVKFLKSKITYKTKSEKICGTPIRLGKPVFDCDGTYLGKLTDLTAEKNKLVWAHVGTKKFAFGDIVTGDAVIIKSSARILKSDVKKGSRVIIRRGTPLTAEAAERAKKHGEYVQANLKTF